MLKHTMYEWHLLVSQLHFCHHHLSNMPESFVLHLLSIFGDVADANSSDFSHMFGGELKRVSGTTVK